MAFFSQTQSRPSFFDPQPSFIETVRAGFERRRKISQVRRKLSNLSDRDLADIGIFRSDIDAIARQSVDRR